MSTSTPSNTWGEITNCKTSKTVKLFKSVHRANKSKRSELGLTIAEGVRLVSDILSNEYSRHLIRRIVVSESLLSDDTKRGNNADQYQQRLRHWLHIVDEESRQRNAQSTSSGTGTSDSIASCSINVGTDEVVAECSGTVTSQGVVASAADAATDAGVGAFSFFLSLLLDWLFLLGRDNRCGGGGASANASLIIIFTRGKWGGGGLSCIRMELG